jgi:acyl-CoA hydrolase
LSYGQDYRRKLVSANQAVKLIKSGDWIDYGSMNGQVVSLDRALAARKDELKDIKVWNLLNSYPARQRSSCFLINTKCRWSKTWVFSISARIIALSITFSNSRILPGQV